MNPLQQLLEYDQSHWLDNLTRGMIRSGELARRVSALQRAQALGDIRALIAKGRRVLRVHLRGEVENAL